MTTILVVDDNPATLRMLTAVLRTDGYRVLGAPDALTALELVERESPDLCIVDMILPGLDGRQLARRLRARPELVDVPIIAVSGLIGSDEQAASGDFDAWIVKPIEPDSLLEVIAAHLPHDDSVVETATATTLLVIDDDPVQAKLSRLHLTSLGFAVTVARSGREALAIAADRRPDAIVSDVLMPDMDGFELCLAVRRDPALEDLPVVLVSAHYRDQADHDLAVRVGANVLLVKSPDHAELAATIAAIVRAPPSFQKPRHNNGDLIRDAHHHVVASRLERAIATNLSLSQRCAILGAQLSLISGIADALTQAVKIDSALQDVLETCFDAAGVSRGALFLDRGVGIELVASVGFEGDHLEDMRVFFGHRDLLDHVILTRRALALPAGDSIDGDASTMILRKSQARSAHIVPLVHDMTLRGALFLASSTSDLAAEGVVSFARAIGGQIVKSLALSRAFDRVAESETRYRTLMDRASCGVVTVSGPSATISAANRAAEALLGGTFDQLFGRPLVDFIAVEDRDRLAAVARLGHWDSWHDVRVIKLTGQLAVAEVSMSRVKAGAEEVILVIANDVTERRHHREKAALTERLTTIGTLAAGVAHEINNPATYVLANLEILSGQLEALAPHTSRIRTAMEEQDPEVRAALLEESHRDGTVAAVLASGHDIVVETLNGAERIRAIAKGMKDLAGHSEVAFTTVDINALLNATINLVTHQVRSHARITTDFASGLPTIVASPSRLSQVFINLVVNASQAIAEGFAADNLIRLTTRMEGERVRVNVDDTGSGIPVTALPRIFEPFFTTKAAGVGTGLGLPITQEIVHAHGGEIRAENLPGRGARFSVWLPCGVAPVASPTPNTQPMRRPGSKRLRVLLVDDELYLLRAMQRMLSREFEVAAATGGRAAIELLDTLAPNHFDVVLSDLTMPEVSGMDLFRWLEEHRPQLAKRTVFMTGGAFTSLARTFLERIDNARIEKPFTPSVVVKLLNSFCDDDISSAK